MAINKFLWALLAPHLCMSFGSIELKCEPPPTPKSKLFKHCECVRLGHRQYDWTSRPHTPTHTQIPYAEWTLSAAPYAVDWCCPVNRSAARQILYAEHSMPSCANDYSIWNGSVLIQERNDHYVTIFVMLLQHRTCVNRMQPPWYLYCTREYEMARAHNQIGQYVVKLFCAQNATPHLIQRIRFVRLIFIVIVLRQH